jgi:WhiB family redox-sensing transcriptional regulator
MREVDDQAWMERARCRGARAAEFFPSDGRGVEAAQRVCAECEVRSECLDYALANSIVHGVWGGTSERERRRTRDGETRCGSRAAASASSKRSTKAGAPALANSGGSPGRPTDRPTPASIGRQAGTVQRVRVRRQLARFVRFSLRTERDPAGHHAGRDVLKSGPLVAGTFLHEIECLVQRAACLSRDDLLRLPDTRARDTGCLRVGHPKETTHTLRSLHRTTSPMLG